MNSICVCIAVENGAVNNKKPSRRHYHCHNFYCYCFSNNIVRKNEKIFSFDCVKTSVSLLHFHTLFGLLEINNGNVEQS